MLARVYEILGWISCHPSSIYTDQIMLLIERLIPFLSYRGGTQWIRPDLKIETLQQKEIFVMLSGRLTHSKLINYDIEDMNLSKKIQQFIDNINCSYKTMYTQIAISEDIYCVPTTPTC